MISTNVGGIENVVLQGKTGFLHDSGDANGLTDSLLQLVENEDLRKRMAAGGWDHVREKYHYTRLVDDTARMYDSLLNN